MKKHKRAFWWTIADIKLISLLIYMHKILIDDNYEPTVQLQKRLHPSMQEVVKKEEGIVLSHEVYLRWKKNFEEEKEALWL